MITTLRGVLQQKTPPHLLIEVNGIGYEVQAPMTTFYKLPTEMQPVLLHTHFVIREDAQQLYGFIEQQDRDLFRILIKANGVGPKLALGILSSIEPQQLIQAIGANDTSSMIKIPGVGKKTAQRLVIECQDAIAKLSSTVFNDKDEPTTASNGHVQDAVDALTTLGYKQQEAKKAVEKIYQSGQSTQAMIRAALQNIVNGVEQ